MILYPAIDLKDGVVVRLFQGKFEERTIYALDPLKVAKHWVAQGAEYMHVVDLDGAKTGQPKNLALVGKIAREAGVPVQCGGGVRSMETIEALRQAGVERVVLGTKAVEDRQFLQQAFEKHGDHVIVSLDAKGGILQLKGWQEGSQGLAAADFGSDLKRLGFSQVIYTDISKDGTLKGPNLKEIRDLIIATGLQVICSGGIASLHDITALKEMEGHGVSGAIIGKALYEGKFTLEEALRKAA